MKLRTSVLIAVAGATCGMAIVYAASFLMDLLNPYSEILAHIVWLATTLLGFAVLILSMLQFFATYMSLRSKEE